MVYNFKKIYSLFTWTHFSIHGVAFLHFTSDFSNESDCCEADRVCSVIIYLLHKQHQRIRGSGKKGQK